MRTLVAVAFLVVVSACGPCDSILTPYCPAGQPCWGDMDAEVPKLAYRGECSAGTVQCAPDGTATCVGTATPTTEICDGLDNDCNGLVDDRVPYGGGPDCREALCGNCARNFQVVCSAGALVCVSDRAAEETCNGRDDDCDCEVDEDLPVELIYSGPAYTIGVGSCRPGAAFCENGQNVTIPEIVPSTEICDGLDNDCDGFVDEMDPTDPRAYYMVLDVSGSMQDTKEAAAEAFCIFAQNTTAGSVFAVATVASADDPPHADLRQDFADATTTCATLADHAILISPTGLEYALEPLTFPLSWPPMDGVALIITDEALEEYVETAADAAALCAGTPYAVFVFSWMQYQDPWQSIIDVCPGAFRDMPTTRAGFLSEFFGLFSGHCGG